MAVIDYSYVLQVAIGFFALGFILGKLRFKPKYIIKKEYIVGVEMYMIYKKRYFGDEFIERWNTFDSANKRLIELNNNKNVSL